MQKSRISLSIILLVAALLSQVYASTLQCKLKIFELTAKYNRNKTECNKEKDNIVVIAMAPYMLYSGKTINDLGLPTQCAEKESLSYFTVQIDLNDNGFVHETYYGFCFTSSCGEKDLNQFGDAIIQDIFNGTLTDTVAIEFISPIMEKSISAMAIILYVLFGLAIAYGMLHSLKKWRAQCRNIDDDDEQSEQDINLSGRYEIRMEDDYQPQLIQETLQQKFSLETKFHQFQESQQSNKIESFSWFKLIAVPWLIFGQLFYLSNFAAYNYFAFEKQIYFTVYSKLAVGAYYLPDIFFFISAFLFADKLLQYQTNQQSLIPFMSKQLGKKLLRLYPLYIVTVLIYWLISPTLHSGPVWFVYENDAKVCNYAWWRAIALIDNWFVVGCYSPGWFVQVQIQLALINFCVLYIYCKNSRIGLFLLGLLTLIFGILLFVISAPLPSSVSTMISEQTEHYLKSTYSHAPFYIMGIWLAFSKNNDKFRESFKAVFLTKRAIVSFLKIVGVGVIVLILMRPSLWEGILGFQLGLCRLGFFISMLPFFLTGIYGFTTKQTILHRYATMSYPIILVSGIVTMSAFWCFQTFPYVSAGDLSTSLVASFFICTVFGVFLGLLIGITKPKYR